MVEICKSASQRFCRIQQNGSKFMAGFKRLLIPVLVVVIALFCCGFDSSQQKVYDNADILSSSEEDKLSKMCVEYAQEVETDIIILTARNTTRKSSMTYAEDFYMANDFGYDKVHGDGVILLIDMYKREIWIATSGKAIDYLSDTRIDNLVTTVTNELKKSSPDYYSACSSFIKKTASYMKSRPSSKDRGGNGETIYVHDAASLSEKLLSGIIIKLAISAGIALIITCILRTQNKAAMTVGKRQYMRNNQYVVRNKTDQFIRSTRVRHTKSSSSDGGGGHRGGSSHRGSGGHRFGGGGGKF